MDLRSWSRLSRAGFSVVAPHSAHGAPGPCRWCIQTALAHASGVAGGVAVGDLALLVGAAAVCLGHAGALCQVRVLVRISPTVLLPECWLRVLVDWRCM